MRFKPQELLLDPLAFFDPAPIRESLTRARERIEAAEAAGPQQLSAAAAEGVKAALVVLDEITKVLGEIKREQSVARVRTMHDALR